MRIWIFLFLLWGIVPLKAGEAWHWFHDDQKLAIQGFDPVAYFTRNEAVKGKTGFTAKHRGLVYRFSSKEHKTQFKKTPARYLPMYGGWCAFAAGVDAEKMGFGAVRFPSDPKSFKIVDGELFLFANVPNFNAKTLWENNNHEEMKRRADAFWTGREQLAKKIGNLPDGMHPAAPMETAQFDPFIGTWENEIRWIVNAEKKTYSQPTKGIWKFYYDWDGFGIRDDYKVIGQPGSGGPAYRSFDPRTKQWVMTYIPSNQPANQTWLFTGAFDEKGNLYAERDGVDARGRAIKARIYFKEIKRDSFQWSADWSYDDGKTWIENFMMATNKRIASKASSE